MKQSEALPIKVVRQLYMRIQKVGISGQPREIIAEAFAFTEEASVAQIARALGYQEQVVQRHIDAIAAKYGWQSA